MRCPVPDWHAQREPRVQQMRSVSDQRLMLLQGALGAGSPVVTGCPGAGGRRAMAHGQLAWSGTGNRHCSQAGWRRCSSLAQAATQAMMYSMHACRSRGCWARTQRRRCGAGLTLAHTAQPTAAVTGVAAAAAGLGRSSSSKLVSTLLSRWLPYRTGGYRWPASGRAPPTPAMGSTTASNAGS